jgi:site-specific recombinase XerD
MKRKTQRWQTMDKGHTTLEQLATQFRTFNRTEGKSARTVEWYDQTLELFLRYLHSQGQSTLLKDLSLEVVCNYIVHLQEWPRHPNQAHFKTRINGLSQSSIDNHVRAIRTFFAWLHREGYTSENLLALLRRPKVPLKVIEPLTEAEISLILSAIDADTVWGSRDMAVVLTLLDTGLRISELANLKVEDAHLEQGYLKVFGKGQKERVVPIGSSAQKSLMRYLYYFRPEPAPDGRDYFLLMVDGSPVSAHTLKLLMRRLAEKSGVKRLHAHLLRHTFAVSYLVNGGDVFSLQQILGHTTLEMVRRYVNLANPMCKYFRKRALPIALADYLELD